MVFNPLHLGPLLFNLYMADLAKTIKYSKYFFYADDIQIYISFKHDNVQARIKDLNTDLESVRKWADVNGLRLNPAKSQVTIFGTARNLSLYKEGDLSVKLA